MGEWVAVCRGVRYREHDSRRIGGGKYARADRYYVIRYSVAGKMRQEGVGWESEGYSDSEAIHLLGVIRRNVREGRRPMSLAEWRESERAKVEDEKRAALGEIIGDSGATFRHVAGLWLEHVRGDLKSFNADEGRLRNHVFPLVGDMMVGEIDRADVAAFVKQLGTRKSTLTGKPISAGTVKHCLVLAGRVMEFARTMPVETSSGRKLLLEGANPFHGHRLRSVDNARWRVSTDAEIDAILGYCAEHGGGLAETYRLCVLLGLQCGARLEEIVTIRKEHLDRSRERIRLVDTKNRGSRFIYPPAELYRGIVAQAARGQGSPWLFPSMVVSDKPVNKDTVGHFFAQACTDLGLNAGIEDRRGRLVFHSLRHTYGTRQVMANVNLMKLKRLMGHSSLSTTERYVHLAEDFLAEHD